MTQGVRHLYGDTETTGLDPDEGSDRICEIAMVEYVDGSPTGRVYHQYVNPGRPMPRDAFDIHGLSDDFLEDKPRFAEVAEGFLEFVRGAVLIFHNAKFDMRFIDHHVAELGLKPTWASHECTLVLAKRTVPNARHSLDALIARFGIDGSERKKHGALIDSKLLAEVHAHLLGRHRLALVQVLATGAAAEADEAFPDSRYAPRDRHESPVRPTDEQLDAHAAFVAGRLKDRDRWGPIRARMREANRDAAPVTASGGGRGADGTDGRAAA